MSVDIGIPICGILQIQGSSQVPPNFAPLDGQVLNEPRSPLNGETLPYWNRVEEIVPYQASPYDGSVVAKPTTYSVKIEETNLPAVEMISSRTFTLTAGATVTTDSGGSIIVVDSDPMFSDSVVQADNEIWTDLGSALSGSARRHVSINDAASSYKFELDHTHSYSIQHTSSTYGGSNHGFKAEKANTTYGLKLTPSGSASITTNGLTTPNNVNFSVVRECVRAKWYMRIY